MKSGKLQKRKHGHNKQISGNSHQLNVTLESNSIDRHFQGSKNSKGKKFCDHTKNKNCSSSKPSKPLVSKEHWEKIIENSKKLINDKKFERHERKLSKNEKTILINADTQSSNSRKPAMITVLQHELFIDKNRTGALIKKYQKQDPSNFENTGNEISSNAFIKIEDKSKIRTGNNSTKRVSKSKNRRHFSTTEVYLNSTSVLAVTNKRENKNRNKNRKSKKVTTTDSVKEDFGVEVFLAKIRGPKFAREKNENSESKKNNSEENETATSKVNITQQFIKNESTFKNSSLVFDNNITNSKNSSENNSETYKFISKQINSSTGNILSSSLSVTESSSKSSQNPTRNKKRRKGKSKIITTTESEKKEKIDPDVELLPSTKSPLRKHKQGNKNLTRNHKIDSHKLNGSNEIIKKNKSINFDYSKLNRNLTPITIGNFTANIGSETHKYITKYNKTYTLSNTSDATEVDTKKEHKKLEIYETITSPKVENTEEKKYEIVTTNKPKVESLIYQSNNKKPTTSPKVENTEEKKYEVVTTNKPKVESLIYQSNNKKPKKENITISENYVKRPQNFTSKQQQDFEMHVHKCQMKCVNYWRKLYEDLLRNVSKKSNGAFEGFTPINEDHIDSGLIDSPEDSLDCLKTTSSSEVMTSTQLPREEEKVNKEKEREGKKKKNNGKKRMRTTARSIEESTTVANVTKVEVSSSIPKEEEVNNKIDNEVEKEEEKKKVVNEEKKEKEKTNEKGHEKKKRRRKGKKRGKKKNTPKITEETTTAPNFGSSYTVSIEETGKSSTIINNLNITETQTSESFSTLDLKDEDEGLKTTEGDDALVSAEMKSTTETSTTGGWNWNWNWNWESDTTQKKEEKILETTKETNVEITEDNFWKITKEDSFWKTTIADNFFNIIKEDTLWKTTEEDHFSNITFKTNKITTNDSSILNNTSTQTLSSVVSLDYDDSKVIKTSPKYLKETTTLSGKKNRRPRIKKKNNTKSSVDISSESPFQSEFQNKNTFSESKLEFATVKSVSTKTHNLEFVSDEDFSTQDTRNKNNLTKVVEIESSLSNTENSTTAGNFWNIFWGNGNENEIKSAERTKKDDKVVSNNNKEEDKEKDDEEDNEDEDDEEFKCKENEHFCDNKCISRDLTCDTTKYCRDGSDEENCNNKDENKVKNKNQTISNKIFESVVYRSPESCGEWEFYCDGQCFNFAKICDGVSDCLDGNDEDWDKCLTGRTETKVSFGLRVRPNSLYKNGFPGEKN